MADNDNNLPLIPGKSCTVCADVKPVLREVFREMDQLPPLALDKTSATDDEKLWIEKYSSECEHIWNQECDLKKEFAKRISKKPQQNLYTLQKPQREKEKPVQRPMGLLERKDLMPGIERNAAGDQSLWVQNILNRSSCDIIVEDKPTAKLQRPLQQFGLDDCSRQTYSIQSLKVPRLPPPSMEVHQPPVPEYIYCVPHQINFVNFSLGQTYTHQLRLWNVSKLEIRLSVSLPRSQELQVELSGSRGLRMTAGADTELKILFHPKNTRTLHDELHIRTSMGKGLVVPIACYMEPPELHIFVQPMDTPQVASIDSLCEISATRNIIDLGTRLLGDEHFATLTLQCHAAHASFFVLTEDAWHQWTVEELTSKGFLKSGPFTIYPAWWAGGGVTRGTARCLATTTGFYKADLKILSSTAVARSLHVVADSVYFSTSHISVEAQERTYDITSDGDAECESYVHLGTAFPNRSLSAAVQIVNQSPMTYSFYWKCRPWGTASTWQTLQDSGIMLEHEDEESDHELDREAEIPKQSQQLENNDPEGNVDRICLEPEAGSVGERSSCTVRVRAPDVGTRWGTQRAVIQLVLKDVPIESFSPEFRPKIVCTRTVEEVDPSGKIWTRTVCDIVQAQVEVLWEVVPVRFFLDPPVLFLSHSRRVNKLTVSFRATQLYGFDDIVTSWTTPASMVVPKGLCLCSEKSVEASLTVPLPSLPNTYPETEIITLKSERNEWAAHCHATRASAMRHPSVAPARRWLGVVPPGARMSASMEVFNNTHQQIAWWATPHRWLSENPPTKICAEAARTCGLCHDRSCTCSMLNPCQGVLEHKQGSTIHYNVYAPTTDCCVATLVKVSRRSEPDVAVAAAPGTEARATLIAYRVLAPRLVLRVFPCGGDKKGECADCDLDPGEKSPQGSSVLRPAQALTLGSCSCYRLRITNTTPVPTSVRWEPLIDGEEFLKVKFLPNNFDIGIYAEKKISVILEPRKVCGRRLFVLRAQITHAYKPLYLVIDTAIDGVQIVCEVPLGGAARNNYFVALRGIQKEVYPWHDAAKPTTPAELFLEEDRKRFIVQENKCHCHFEMVYFPSIKPLLPPRERREDETPTPPEIVTAPPSLVRVCECFGKTEPILPEHDEPCCLQFRDLPLRTVQSRRMTLRNVGHVTARWRMVVRRWPRTKNRTATVEALSTGKDRWAGDVRPPGLVIQCTPDKGICTAGQQVDILVQVYADCWGLYYDQIMLMVEHVDPIVVDVWIEAVGPPLQFATPGCRDSEYDSTMWNGSTCFGLVWSPLSGTATPQGSGTVPDKFTLSSSNPERKLRVKNTSRSRLTVRAYTLLEHEHTQDALPFRLYMRFTDVLLPVCACSSFVSSDSFGILSEETPSSMTKQMGTGIELYLGEDCGLEDKEYYTVDPRECTVAAGAWMEWSVNLNPGVEGEPIPAGLVLLRTIPDDDRGNYWRRCEPPPARVGVRAPPRAPALSVSCREVRAQLCALELPYNRVARIRKRFQIRNTGTAPLSVRCVTAAPWQLVMNKSKREECTSEHERGERHHKVELVLEPWSSTEMCVEVSIDALELWPVVEDNYDEVRKTWVPPSYAPVREITGQLMFYSDHSHLETLPMKLMVNYPHLSLEPAAIDFGFVTHEDTRKTYFTVWHSSLTANLDLVVSWRGNAELRLYPLHLRVAPGKRTRIYVQYTAKWTGEPVTVEGQVLVSCREGSWCRAALPVRANPSRDATFRHDPHDYTDEWHLSPPSVPKQSMD